MSYTVESNYRLSPEGTQRISELLLELFPEHFSKSVLMNKAEKPIEFSSSYWLIKRDKKEINCEAELTPACSKKSNIKPIQTEYKGYHFRSRGEARWAVVFDALLLDWEYEPEGYMNSEGIKYLPDFCIHNVNGVDGGDLFIEIKRQNSISVYDLKKWHMFSEFKPLYIVSGNIPFAYKRNGRWFDAMLEDRSCSGCFYSNKYINGEDTLSFLGVNNDGEPELFQSCCLESSHPWVMNAAFQAGRKCRFEHGESPEDAFGFDAATECIKLLREKKSGQ